MKATAIALILGFGMLMTGADAKPGHGHAHGHMRYRQIQTTTLPDSQIAYALRHQRQSMAQLRNLRTIDITRIRIVRLTARQKARFHVAGAFAPQQMAFENFSQLDAGTSVAQIVQTNNPLINQIQQILGGILVQNAINQATGGINNGGSCGTDQYGNPVPCNNGGYGTNNAGSTLANVLLSSGIPLSSLIGILFSGGGILNAIVG